MTTLQLKIFKPSESSGRLRCSTDRGEIRVRRIQLTSYSIISCLEPGVGSQREDRLHGVENILLDIDWLDPGVCAGTVTEVTNARGQVIRQESHYNHMLALHSRGAGQLENTGGLEMSVNSGVIPSIFEVKLYRFTGQRIGDDASHKLSLISHGEIGNRFQYELVTAEDTKMYDINLNFTFVA